MTDVLRELVLPRLEGVRKSGAQWMARCPAHEDRQASLSLAYGKTQPVVLNCHANCERDDILGKLGLTWAELSAPRAAQPGGRQVIAEYAYTGEGGEVLFVKVRYFPKDFRVKRPDGHGGWAWNIGPAPRVLYQLPRVVAATAADVIWVCEGEKDCDALAGVGEIATCNFDGAGKWKPEYSQVLAGRDVLIVADRDDQGRGHARQVAASLAGVAGFCWIVQAAAGKDAADHLQAGLTVCDFTWWAR